MKDTLSYIGEKLNEANIIWGVGASILLNKYKLIDSPNDIDIFVDIKDIDKLDKILSSIGTKKEWENSDTYSTKYFYEYKVNKVDIDVMAGFCVNHSDGVYEYIFDKDSICDYEVINNICIPYTSLEDWYVIYQLIPNREYKVDMIKNYLLENDIKNEKLLKRSLIGNLPIKVKNNINKLLKQKGEV